MCSCAADHERPPRDPVIRVEYGGNVYDFVLNDEAACGTLENGMPYVEAKWVRAPAFEEDPPFYIKGAGGWEGRTYTDPHTWIYGVYDIDNGTREFGFAIHGEDRPGFDENGEFRWSGVTPLGDEMKVEVVCP